MTDYVSLAALQEFIGNKDPAKDAAVLSRSITAASSAVDQFCNRTFGAAGPPASGRLYFPQGQAVDIDDAAAVTSVSDAASAQLVPATDYRPGPANAPALGHPFTGLWLKSAGYYPDGLTVVATWGWPAIPTAVVEATLLMAHRLYKRKDAPFGIAGVDPEGGVVRLSSLDPDLRLLLRGYRRVPLA